MKKIAQNISSASLPVKVLVSILLGGILLIILYVTFLRKEPEYTVKFGKIYSVKGDKAVLVGDYSDIYESVLLNEDEVIVKTIYWGNKETHFIINGEEHIMGPNAKMSVEDSLIVLTDNSRKKKKVDKYGNRVR